MARFTIHNESSGLASFELLRISSTFDEFDQFLVDARDGIDAGEPPPTEIPNISDELDDVELSAGTSGKLVADLTAGVHAVLCVVRGEHDDILTVFAVGPYEVSE